MQYVTQPALEARGIASWPAIDTVLLDMDGTLLDLRFDNYFWLEVVPHRYAQRHALTLADAHAALRPRFASKQGTLDWYCTDFWSRELDLDIALLKAEVREVVRYLPGAEKFLRELKASGLRRILVTNAHPDALRIKEQQTNLLSYLDAAVSSHQYGFPKEHPEFWSQLLANLQFDRERTLFIDDSVPVLRAAQQFGIRHLVAIAHPDSTLTRREIDEFPSVHAVAELLERTGLPRASD
jgi:5'-nucleotidase